jgi:hypothetical protein
MKDNAQLVAENLVTAWINREKHWLDGGENIHPRATDSLIADIAAHLRVRDAAIDATADKDPPLPTKKKAKGKKAD